jgi:hypothetical protein
MNRCNEKMFINRLSIIKLTHVVFFERKESSWLFSSFLNCFCQKVVVKPC